MAEDLARNPWDELVEILESRDGDRLHGFLEQIGPAETARAISSTSGQSRSASSPTGSPRRWF